MNLSGEGWGGGERDRNGDWPVLTEKPETWEINNLQGRGIFILLTFLQIISAELHFTLTKQDLSPIALCVMVRRTFSNHTDNTGNFPPFCVSSECQGRCHNFCLSLVFAVFPDTHQERPLFQQQLGGIRNVLFYSVLPLPVHERFWVVEPGTFFFQCCYSHTAHGPAFPSF